MPKPQPRERQFIVDYVTTRYPGERVKYNCPVGLPPTRLVATFGLQKSLKMAMGSRLMVDAIIFKPDRLILIESKIREWVNGIAKLPIYSLLIDSTPELKEYWGWPRDLICALPYTNEYIESTARLAGVTIDYFTSDVVAASMQEVEKYQDPAWRKQRAQDRATAESLGLNV